MTDHIGSPPGQTPTVCVFAPTVLLTVTVEPWDGGDDLAGDVHLHPGGQGFWTSRMLLRLGERPVLCGPVGGESGLALTALLTAWQVPMRPTAMAGSTPCLVADRRSGRRRAVAASPIPRLDRHEVDDLYSSVLQAALETRLCVVTGLRSDHDVPPGFFRRLAADLGSAGVTTVGDLHGPALAAWLDGGPMDVLKLSHEDLAANGHPVAGVDEAGAVLEVLVGRGARGVVISFAEAGAVALLGGRLWVARPLPLSIVDPGGAGDAMTAGLAAGLRRGLEPADLLRLACAAGATSVARHGLATGLPGLVGQLVDEVRVEELEAA